MVALTQICEEWWLRNIALKPKQRSCRMQLDWRPIDALGTFNSSLRLGTVWRRDCSSPLIFSGEAQLPFLPLHGVRKIARFSKGSRKVTKIIPHVQPVILQAFVPFSIVLFPVSKLCLSRHP
jgi:hypothetical protein